MFTDTDCTSVFLFFRKTMIPVVVFSEVDGISLVKLAWTDWLMLNISNFKIDEPQTVLYDQWQLDSRWPV